MIFDLYSFYNFIGVLLGSKWNLDRFLNGGDSAQPEPKDRKLYLINNTVPVSKTLPFSFDPFM